MTALIDPEQLSPEQFEHLGSLFLRRAEHLRRRLSAEEAGRAMDQANVGPGDGSPFEHLLRARAAARSLMLQRWRPDQVAEALVIECNLRCEACAVLGLGVDAVAAGIADALEEGRASDVS